MTHDPDRREAALDWLVRTNDPEFDRWDDFTAWLEESPANADAYHAPGGRRGRDAAAGRGSCRPCSEPVRVPERRRLALAASVAALAVLGTAVIAPRMMPVDYSTGPGEVRIVSLGGQDQLVMNGDTKLQLAGWDRRSVTLEQGQVLLRLRDPGEDKVELLSGDLKLVDVGTVFEVSRDGRNTRVLVSEGAVVADPDGAGLKLAAGQRLDTERRSGRAAGDAGRCLVGRIVRARPAHLSRRAARKCRRRPPPVDGYRLFGECRYQHPPFHRHLVGCRSQTRPPLA